MKTKLLIGVLLAAGSLFAGPRVFVGVGVGGYGYYPPAPVVAYAPPCPGPGFYWTPGSWYWSGPRHLWRNGYWAPRPHWVGPRYFRHDDRNWGGRNYRDRNFRDNRRGRR